MFQTYLNKIKAWFKYSETLFIARTEAVAGLVIAGVGVMDWSPLLNLDINTGFSQAQVMYLGGISFVKGIVTEIARRRNAPELV